jgi:DNA polymerase III epsilon subunit-like protein
LAQDYAGTGKVVSMKVKAKDLLADKSSGEGAYTEEMVYRPAKALDSLGIDFQSATMDASGTRLPTPGAFTGRFQKIMEGAKNWKDVAKRLKGETVTYFDFETTGIPDYDGQNITNDPVQLGAVQVKDGKIVKRFNVYINPESKLSDWSANNLKRDVVDENGDRVLDENGRPESTLVTPEWLAQQTSQEQALKDFIEFIGPNALLGGQNVPFDVEILKRMADKFGIDLDIAGTIDSKDLASLLPKYDPEKGIDGPKAPDRKTGEIRATSSLGPVANFLGFEPANWHSADGDAEDSYNLVSKIIDRAGKEGNEDLSLLDFPAMAERYKQRMDEFKAVVSPDSPITEAQQRALQNFADSESLNVSDKAKEALANASTRGEAAKALADIHAEDEADRARSNRPLGANPENGTPESFEPDFDDEESDPDFDDVDLSDFLAEINETPIPQPAPKPVAKPAAVAGSVREKASEFSARRRLGMKRNEIPKLAIDVENLTELRIPGAKPRVRAYAPTSEAIEVKDEMVALGRELVDQSLAEVTAELKSEGIIDESFETVDEAVQAFSAMNLEANQELTDTQRLMVPTIRTLRMDAFDELTAEQRKEIANELNSKLGLEMTEAQVLDFMESGDPIEIKDKSEYNSIWDTEKLSEEQLEANKLINVKRRAVREKIEDLINEKVFKTPVGDYKLTDNEWGIVRELHLKELAGIVALQKSDEKLAQIQKLADSMNELGKTRRKFDPDTLTKEINKRLRDKAMKTLKDNGFKFDSVPLSAWDGVLISSGSGRKPISERSALGKMLLEAFQYVPQNVLLASIDMLKINKRKLTIRQTKPHVRAHFEETGLLIRGGTADHLLHEFWHFVQAGNKNIRALEHAWLYGRMADKNGNLPGLIATGASSAEQAFAVNGLNDTYISKQYEDFRSGFAFFHPKNAGTEVTTTLMQDLFTAVGKYSKPNGRTAKTGNGRSTKVYEDPYYDEATGIWYADSTKQTVIQPRLVYGRDASQGIDYDFKAFGFGLLMALHDWDAK